MTQTRLIRICARGLTTASTMAAVSNAVRVTRLIHMCDVTDLYVWRDSFICVTWLIHMCDEPHSYVTWLRQRLIHLCAIELTTASTMAAAVNAVRVTWLIHMYACGAEQGNLSHTNNSVLSAHVLYHTTHITWLFSHVTRLFWRFAGLFCFFGGLCWAQFFWLAQFFWHNTYEASFRAYGGCFRPL